MSDPLRTPRDPHHSDPEVGLTQAEAGLRLEQDGPNELPSAAASGLLRRMGSLLREPMLALLLAATALYWVLGDWREGAVLGVFVVGIFGLALVQEGRSHAALRALRELSAPVVRVRREGTRLSLPARELVAGDWIELAEGDRVPADAWLYRVDHLQVDESMLTGESTPVEKQAADPHPRGVPVPPGPMDAAAAGWVFGGSFVVAGSALAEVRATGPRSQMGRIGATLADQTMPPTPLQRQTARWVRQLAAAALVSCALLVLWSGWRSGNWLQGVLAGIALAMAMLPEEFPVIMALFPARAAQQLARQGVLTRRLNALETLGAVTVLCTDKTGTLTQNRMRVHTLVVQSATGPVQSLELATLGEQDAFPEAFHRLLEHSILASAPQAFDPMERAFHALGAERLAQTEHLHADWTLLKTYPLSAQLRAMTHVWQRNDGQGHVVSAKGAPEAVVELCHLPQEASQAWLDRAAELAARGLRVLAVAQARWRPEDGADWPASEHQFDFECLGLIGLADPLRAEVPEAMRRCAQAGVRVLMITGDFATTAQAIARQAGMAPGEALSGAELDALSDANLGKRLQRVSVCARISPAQKLRLVQALRQTGEVVAMTGDGVNDAPALRAAHVGIAMGGRGTDVAREAADLVLVRDDFASIVGAIAQGRRVFAELRQAMAYVLAVHVPVAVCAVWPMLSGAAVLLLPLHIAWIELLIDPTSALAFSDARSQERLMAVPPRSPEAPLLPAPDVLRAVAAGSALLAACGLGVAGLAALRGSTTEELRTVLLLAFALGNLGLVWALRRAAGGAAPSWGVLALLTLPGVLLWGLSEAAQLWPDWGLWTGLSPLRGAAAWVAWGSALLALCLLVCLGSLWRARASRP